MNLDTLTINNNLLQQECGTWDSPKAYILLIDEAFLKGFGKNKADMYISNCISLAFTENIPGHIFKNGYFFKRFCNISEI